MMEKESGAGRKKIVYGLLGVFLVLAAFGFFSAIAIQVQGQTVFGATDFVPWNILIPGYVFMALTASGLCLTANFFEIMHIERFQLLQKRAHFLAISFLVPALAMLSMDLGRVINSYHFLLNPQLSSPLFWMGLVYVFYLLLLVLEFGSIHTGRRRIAYAFSVITLITAVVATSVLGSIFSVILDRTLWFGAGTPVWYVFSAITSGIAAMIGITSLTYKLTGTAMSAEMKRAMKELGVILTALLLIGL